MQFSSKFSDDEIAAIFDAHDAGVPREDLCQRHGITMRTFFRWKAKVRPNRPSLERRIKALELENAHLRDIIAAGLPAPAVESGSDAGTL